MPKKPTKCPIPHRIAVLRGTRAETDEQLLQSWLDSLNSPHTRRNFETTARRFLAELPMGLRCPHRTRKRHPWCRQSH
jgi:hypothetical protein